jgi:alkylation response protein AidB-like acyl-CoA dehydrogenase
MYNTEHGWRIVDDALQIRGGRGYETARINLIFEGSSEIMRLFIAREAVDHHFRTAFALVDKNSTGSDKRAAFGRVMKFYPFWYPSRWVGRGQVPTSFGEFGKLAGHLRYAERHARKLGRSIFHAMVRYGPKLERKQMVLFRAVDIGAELFAIAATCARAKYEVSRGNKGAIALADVFCREARLRVDDLFENFYGATDDKVYKLAQQVLKGEHAWLESGIIGMTDYESAQRWELEAEDELRSRPAAVM